MKCERSPSCGKCEKYHDSASAAAAALWNDLCCRFNSWVWNLSHLFRARWSPLMGFDCLLVSLKNEFDSSGLSSLQLTFYTFTIGLTTYLWAEYKILFAASLFFCINAYLFIFHRRRGCDCCWCVIAIPPPSFLFHVLLFMFSFIFQIKFLILICAIWLWVKCTFYHALSEH